MSTHMTSVRELKKVQIMTEPLCVLDVYMFQKYFPVECDAHQHGRYLTLADR